MSPVSRIPVPEGGRMTGELYGENCYEKLKNSMKTDDLALELGVSNLYTITPDLTRPNRYQTIEIGGLK